MDHQSSGSQNYLDDTEAELLFEPVSRHRASTWPSSRFILKDGPDDGTNEDGRQSTSDGGDGSGRASHDDGDGQLLRKSAEDGGGGSSSSVTGTGSSGGTFSTPFGASPTGQAKKNSSRRNAWGNMSYADLITQAIDSSPEKRLTLSQIYDWMVQNIGFFKDKGDSNSSAGWKNSIRHNLSLHNRFKREQNEGTGKSSWWTINADAKPGKSSRRRAATLETPKYEKRRGRVRKAQEERRRLGLDASALLLGHRSPSSPINEMSEYSTTQPAISVSPLHNPTLQALQEPFRSRTNSDASSYGRLSPVATSTFDDHTPALSPHPWTLDGSGSGRGHLQEESFHPAMAELDAQMTQSMQLHDGTGYLREKTYNSSTGHNGGFFHAPNDSRWSKASPSTFLTSDHHVSRPNGPSPLSKSPDMSPIMNAQHFSGGSFIQMAENNASPKSRHAYPAVPPGSHRLPSLPANHHFSGGDARFLPPTPQNQNQPFRAILRPSTTTQITNPGGATSNGGTFPADLDLFMDTVPGGGFSGVDVDEVLNYEMNVGGNLNLLDVNFDSCLSGATGSATPASTSANHHLPPWS